VLSILIPIYNYHCSELIETLHSQGKYNLVPFEIRILDDGSSLEFKSAHRKLSQLEFVHYEESDRNLGRSQVRNRLAKEAKYPYLLFLDCDSKITTNSFLRLYTERLSEKNVIYGGRIYNDIQPLDSKYALHWKYGREREARSTDQRKRSPYLWFHSNNFVIPKKLLLSLPFDESVTTYGYEDSILSAELRKRNVQIEHINNPVIHLGLIPNDLFLEKSRLALKNLHSIIKSGNRIPVRLVKAYKLIKLLGLKRIFINLYHRKHDDLLKTLLNGDASLKNFDYYRLGYLLSLDDQ